jgi:hypothetical protein
MDGLAVNSTFAKIAARKRRRQTGMSWLSTVDKMVQQNKNVQFAGKSNFEEISTRKSGWGYIKIAIPNELAQKLLSTDEYNGGLLLFSCEEFKEAQGDGGFE